MTRSLFAALLLALPMSAFAVGAIAVDDEVGELEPGYGYVTGMSSEKEAKAGALKECRNSGNKSCTVAVWLASSKSKCNSQ